MAGKPNAGFTRIDVRLKPDAPGTCRERPPSGGRHKTDSGSTSIVRRRLISGIAATPATHMYLGLTLYYLHNNAEAEKELKAAIDSSGNQLSIAHYYLGGLYWKLSDYHRAADELETYLHLTPDAPDAERVRGTIKQLRAK